MINQLFKILFSHWWKRTTSLRFYSFGKPALKSAPLAKTTLIPKYELTNGGLSNNYQKNKILKCIYISPCLKTKQTE